MQNRTVQSFPMRTRLVIQIVAMVIIVSIGLTPFTGLSAQRGSLDQAIEKTSSGNGLTGHDENSENLTTAFLQASPTPGAPLTTTGSELAQPGTCYGSIGNAGGSPLRGNLITVDVATGAGTVIGATGFARVQGLAINSDGEIFGTSTDEFGNTALFKINASTGEATAVGIIVGFTVEGIAFDGDDVLFGVSFDDGILLAIDTATALATEIGFTAAGIVGLAFDPTDGTLYGSSTFGGPVGSGDLFTIDHGSGATTHIGTIASDRAVTDIHFDATGRLYGAIGGFGGGAASELFAIDKTTGAGIFIGSIGITSVSGLAFHPAQAENAPPTVVTEVATDVTGTSATLNATINPNGLDTIYGFEFGETTSYGTFIIAQELLTGTIAIAVSEVIEGLTPNTTYHYRAVATNDSGSADGADRTFITTGANPPPSAPRNLQASAGDAQVTLTWDANSESDFLRYRIYGAPTTNPATAIDSVDGVANTSRIVGSLPNDTEHFFRITAVDDALQESEFSNQVSATPEAPVDQSPPQIDHSAITGSTAGQDQIIVATLFDNVGIESATLFFRPGGAADYASDTMTDTGGDQYSGTVPESFVTERGVDYYIFTEDAAGNIATRPPVDPENNPFVIQVASSNLAFSSPSFAYRMISVPIALDNRSPASVFADDLGQYDNTEWRLLRSVSGSLSEFPNTGNVDPGKGFWLITRTAETVGTGSGQSVTTGQNFQITLEPGWNQIGNPFAFTVNFSDIVKSASVEEILVGYQGSRNEPTGYDFTRTQLAPFEGFFVNNNSASTATIEIPPQSATGTVALAKKDQALPGIGMLQSMEWTLRIRAQVEQFLDKDNYIGVVNGASDGWDRYDFSEAPFFDQYVSLYFPHEDWETFFKRYTGDFRSITRDGHFWDFIVRTNIPHSEVVLNVGPVNDLPPDWQVVLLDKESRVSVNLREPKPYTFLGSSESTQRDFRIIAGKIDFVETHDLDISTIPDNFALSQNYPNPFNPETHIDYELPHTSEVRVGVYNLKGQQVRVLFDGKQSAGRYTLSWDGKSEKGVAVASGVYLVSLQAGKFVSVKKILLTK